MLKVYLIYTAAACVAAFVLFFCDKVLSKKEERRRIPEEVLLAAAAFGGSAGALLGMYTVHHKTNFKTKFHFAIGAWFAFATQASAAFIIALAENGFIGA